MLFTADRTLLPTDPLCTLTIPVPTDVVTADFHIHRLLGGCHDKKWRPQDDGTLRTIIIVNNSDNSDKSE